MGTTSRLGRALSRTLAGSALALVMLAGSTVNVSAQQVTLSMVGAWAPGVSADADIAIRFMEEVNRLGEGLVEIEYRGAAEVVPVFDQPEALVRGIFDIGYGAPNYWAGIVPAGYITELATTDLPDQGPDSELFQFMTDMFEGHGVRYLGHYAGDANTGQHFISMQREISSIDDLQGATIRVPPLTRFFVEAVGAEPMTLPPGEIYIALERGTVEGFSWPYFDGFTNFGWHEVASYLIDEPLYRNGVGIYINLDKWNSLSAEVQDILMEAIRTTQYWAIGWVAAHQIYQLETMQAAGMQVIKLPEEESQRWAEIAGEALWDHFRASMSEEDYSRARTLLGYD